MEKETMKLIIKNPVDIAHFVYKAAAAELDEIIEDNQKRNQRFQKPLRIPKWNVKQMLQNIDSLTEMTFSEPRFQEYTNLYPWDNQSSCKAWAQIAKIKLRDDYLIKLANDDYDLLQQLCEVWPELTPDSALTKEQLSKLAKLQLQADDIIKKATLLENEFIKLAEQEKDVLKNTKSKYDTLISNQLKYLHVNKQYYKEHVKKWR